MNDIKQIGADRLAYAVANLIQKGYLDSRSEAADALLDYLEIGTPGKSSTVTAWMDNYESQREKATK